MRSLEQKMDRRTVLAAAWLVMGGLMPLPSAATDAETLTRRCQAARHKIIGTYSKCVANAEARAVKTGKLVDRSGCLRSFERRWQKTLSKYEQSGDCYQSVGFWNRAGQIVVDQHLALRDLMKTDKRVFVSSQPYASDFGNQRLAGGLVSFDLQCTALAHSAGLGGHWVAWMSSSQANAVDRLIGGGPFRRLDSVIVADSIADLTDGSLYAPINVDEKGNVLQGAVDVWTGTDENGLLIPGRSCSDWTSADGEEEGQLGIADLTSASWSNWDWVFCAGFSRIYCIEQ